MADETLKSFVEKWATNFNCNAEMNTANQALVLIRKLAEKLDTDGAGSSPVQPDWSQNDEAASDYIKKSTRRVHRKLSRAQHRVGWRDRGQGVSGL